MVAIDIGTSAVKAVRVARDGAVLGRARVPHASQYPAPLAQEQDPNVWLGGAVLAVQQLALGSPLTDVVALSVTGQMSALVLSDADGVPVRPAVLLADGRADNVLGLLEPVASDIQAACGSRPQAVFLLAKLLWVHEHEPDAYARTAHVLAAKDYVRQWLTGTWLSEPSDMGNSQALDLRTRAWRQDILRRVGVDPALWPPLVNCGAKAGELRSEAARRLELPPGLPVVAGAADGATTLLGSGVLDATQILVGSGSSLPVMRILPGPCRASGLTWHPTARGDVYAMASLLGAGLGFSWWAELLSTTPTGLEALARESQCQEPPVWLPYLLGRGSPDFASTARAALAGVSAGHGRADIALAAYQGVACEVADAVHNLTAHGGVAPSGVVLAGGGASRLLAQEIAGMQGLAVDVVAESHVSAYGAAILAAEHAWGREPSSVWRLPRVRVAPVSDVRQRYERLRRRRRRYANALRVIEGPDEREGWEGSTWR